MTDSEKLDKILKIQKRQETMDFIKIGFGIAIVFGLISVADIVSKIKSKI